MWRALPACFLPLALLASGPALADEVSYEAAFAGVADVVHPFTGESDPLSLREAVTERGLPWPPPRFWLGIDKSERRLTAWSGNVALKHYAVGLGDPVGDKVRQGDRKTPDGVFRVVTRNDRSAFHLFLGLSYPDAEDARRGVSQGIITAAQAEAIVAASEQGRLPSWSSSLGGAIGIHGGGSGADWTLGCIAVENDEIEELWELARSGTRVRIEE